MLAFGADPKLQDVSGWLSLDFALRYPCPDGPSIAELLLRHRADPNDKNFGNGSPLVYAIEGYKSLTSDEDELLQPSVSAYRVRMAEVLIEAGADVNLCVERSGVLVSPLEVALTEPYPLTDHLSTTEGQNGQFVRGAALDLYYLQMEFALATAYQGTSVASLRAVQSQQSDSHMWEDRLIGTLLDAGARVSKELLVRVYVVLKSRDAPYFC
ncbi:hypothetical protein CONLIGDRAFT_693294 [Coniochaeta ligniaria NRRL 30616]|uniref:Uncharacterized protein n=1 Tax=Coniochaeta ligniaria NRRL 30616 TaxID=1408157 RepID=A0A1J7I7P1_9PEZI|nr:hypothetical protein CONLIGDRAFT_693294 [Coniochaeta ligniaria NRRL 30616]